MTVRTLKAAYTVALAGFANPRYISGDPVNDSTGIDISNAKAVGLSVISMGTNTIVAEQTYDLTGATGWFPVLGKRSDDALAALVSSGFAAAKAYIFPALGARMRFRVTALATADLVCQLGIIADTLDQSQGAGASAIPAGTALIGAVVESASSAVGNGTTHAKIATTASLNLTSVKAAAGKLYRYHFRNNTASAKFAKLYNKASAPVVATDVPIETIIIPANGVASYLNPIGKAMSAGIAYAITGAIGDTDTTNTAVNDVVGALDYI